MRGLVKAVLAVMAGLGSAAAYAAPIACANNVALTGVSVTRGRINDFYVTVKNNSAKTVSFEVLVGDFSSMSEVYRNKTVQKVTLKAGATEKVNWGVGKSTEPNSSNVTFTYDKAVGSGKNTIGVNSCSVP